jgi:hypothetical protein
MHVVEHLSLVWTILGSGLLGLHLLVMKVRLHELLVHLVMIAWVRPCHYELMMRLLLHEHREVALATLLIHRGRRLLLLLKEHLALGLGRREMKARLLLLRIDMVHALHHYLLLLTVLPLNDAILHLVELVPRRHSTTKLTYLKYL